MSSNEKVPPLIGQLFVPPLCVCSRGSGVVVGFEAQILHNMRTRPKPVRPVNPAYVCVCDVCKGQSCGNASKGSKLTAKVRRESF